MKKILFLLKIRLGSVKVKRLNLCGVALAGYCNLDFNSRADIWLDLEKSLLPFPDNSLERVVCISAINYFTRERGAEIIKDVYRAVQPDGVVRFGVQDLKEIARKYVNNDREFFFQKHPNGSGRDRFAGETMCDKINSWFYGYPSGKGMGVKYFYDYETLALLFKRAGFTKIEQKSFQESLIPDIDKIDNREDQMFFLEAIK